MGCHASVGEVEHCIEPGLCEPGLRYYAPDNPNRLLQNGHMKVTTRKQPTKPSRKARSSSEVRFDKAWQRVVNQQKKNSKLREEVKRFAERVSTALADEEQAYVKALYQACEHLLPFYGRKSLTLWQRDALLHWVTDYISIIRNNPFAADLDLTPLLTQMETMLAAMHPELVSITSGQDHPADDGDEGVAFDEGNGRGVMDDLFEELSAEFGDDAGFDDFAQWFNEQKESYESAHQQRQAEDQALDRLMKASSINKLFRKVVRVLHPDREQDEEVRTEKNRLMSELVEARESHDIPTIFALYSKYVGESPLQELGGDLESITLILQRQFEQLRDQQDDIIHEDPVAGTLYQHFHEKSEKTTWRNIEAHRVELGRRVADLQLLSVRVTSVNKLKPYLEERWEYMNQEYPFEFD